ncbi:MAG: gliding motility-associated C-terminal domain-containing protein [Saprospiraceae bacterium]
MPSILWRIYILLDLIFLIGSSSLFAQRHTKCGSNPVQLSNICSDACLVCDLNGASARTTNTIVGQAPPGYCTQVQHSMQWLAFIAGSANLSFNVTVSNCTQANGVEMGVYASDDCQTFRLVSNCNTNMFANQTWPFSTTEALKIGCIYYLVFDGNGPNSCNVDFAVTAGSAMAPVPNTTAKIIGKKLVCKGETVDYNIAQILGACAYDWRVENGTLNFSKDNLAQVTWDQPGIGKICVQGSNECHTGNEVCLDVEIGDDSPLTEYGPFYVCFGESYKFNNVFLTAGTWDYFFKNKYGCDSNITVVIEELELLETHLDTFLCFPDSLKIGQRKFDSSGIYKLLFTSKQKPFCDSTVFINLKYSKLISIPNKTNDISCIDTLAILYADSSQYPINGTLSYLWTTIKKDTLGLTSQLEVTQAGEYTLQIIYTLDSIHSCTSAHSIIVKGSRNFPDLLLLDSLKFCLNDTIYLSSISFLDQNNTNATYSFYFNDSCTQHSRIDSNFLILQKDTTIYLKASNGTCEDIIALPIKINAIDRFHITDVSICLGEELDLSTLAFTKEGNPIGNPVFYSCSIPDSNCILKNLKSVYLKDTTFYTYPEKASCPDFTNFKIIIKPKPSATFNLNKTDYCLDDSMRLSLVIPTSDSLEHYFLKYNTNEIQINSTANAYYQLVKDTGFHQICLRSDRLFCRDTFCTFIQVHPQPIVPIIDCFATDSSILFSWPFYTGETYKIDTILGGPFNRLSDTSIYFYNLNRGQTIKIRIRSSNPYCIEQIAEIECQSKTCPSVIVDIIPVDTLCIDANSTAIQLNTNTSPNQIGGIWNWRGPGIIDSISGLFNPAIAGPGNHRIQVLLNQNGCRYLGNTTIIVRENPFADFTLDSVVCQDSLIQIKFIGNRADSSSFLWNLDNGIFKFTKADRELEVKWATPGKKQLLLKLNNYKCFNQQLKEIEVLAPLQKPNLICESTDTTIIFKWSTTKRVKNYKIKVLNGNIGQLINDSTYLIKKRFFNDSAGIQLTIEDSGPCSAINSDIYNCKSPDCLPKNLIQDTVLRLCISNPQMLVLNQFIKDTTKQYQWLGPFIQGNTINTSFLISGSYLYILQGEDFGCKYDDSLFIHIHAVPEIRQLNIQHLPCDPQIKTGSVEFKTVITKNPPLYYSLDGIIFNAQAVINNLIGGQHLLYIKDSLGCISDTLIEIKSPEIPFIDLGPDLEILKGEQIQLSAIIQGSYTIIDWISSQSLSCLNCTNPLLIPEYSLKIYCNITNEDGCTALDSINIKVFDNKIFAPNAFSPNGDNINDIFSFFGNAKSIRLLEIYDRWGEKVFSKQNFLANELEQGWNGRSKDKNCLPGVYVYYGIVEFEKGNDQVLIGDVSLIR